MGKRLTYDYFRSLTFLFLIISCIASNGLAAPLPSPSPSPTPGPLVCNAGGPISKSLGQPVTLNGSSTGGFAPIKYAWVSPPGISPATANTASFSPTISNASDIPYSFTLTCTDARDKSATRSTTVSMSSAFSCSASASPETVTLPGSVILTAVGSGGKQTYRYLWTLPDGVSLTPPGPTNTLRNPSISVSFAQAGSHLISYACADANGALVRRAITITAVPCPGTVSCEPTIDAPSQTFTLPSNASSLLAARHVVDLEHDGTNEFVVYDPVGTSFSVYQVRNNGPLHRPTLNLRGPLHDSTGAILMLAGVDDFQFVGPDLVILHQLSASFPLLGIYQSTTSNGDFLRPQRSFIAEATGDRMDRVDLDGDGIDELVVYPTNRDVNQYQSAWISIFRGQNAAQMNISQRLALPDWPRGIQIGDINQDGILDIVSLGSDIAGPVIRTYVGTRDVAGKVSFNSVNDVHVQRNQNLGVPRSFVLGAFDSVSGLDLRVHTHNGHILEYSGTASAPFFRLDTVRTLSFEVGDRARRLFASNFVSDGRARVYLGLGATPTNTADLWSYPDLTPVISAGDATWLGFSDLADLNSDGDPEIIYSTSSSTSTPNNTLNIRPFSTSCRCMP